MIKNILTNMKTVEKKVMPEEMRKAYAEHAKKIAADSLESLIRNKDKAYVDFNDEIAKIYADELKSRNPKHLEDEEKQSTEFTDEDIQRFGKSALNIK